MDSNKENMEISAQEIMDDDFLTCTEVFCEPMMASVSHDNFNNNNNVKECNNSQQNQIQPRAVDPQQQQSVMRQQLPKVLQVPAMVDSSLVADNRVLRNMIGIERRYLPGSPDYFRTVQQEIKPHMRKIVADWMLEVCQELGCPPEVFCLAMNLMDRFLARCRIGKNQLQLLGAVCLFLASKFRETAPIPSEKLVMYTDFSVTLEEIRDWELLVLHKIKWDLSSSTPLDYLDHLMPRISLVKARGVDAQHLRRKVETVIALTTTHYLFSYVRPSIIASAAIAVGLRNVIPDINQAEAQQFLAELRQHAQANADDLEACTSCMINVLPNYLTMVPISRDPRTPAVHEPVVAAADAVPTSTATISVAVVEQRPADEDLQQATAPRTPEAAAATAANFPTDLNTSLPNLMDNYRQSSMLVKSC